MIVLVGGLALLSPGSEGRLPDHSGRTPSGARLRPGRGSDMAGMGYDDDLGRLIVANQAAAGRDSNCGNGDFRDWEFNLLDFDNGMVKVGFLFESDE